MPVQHLEWWGALELLHEVFVIPHPDPMALFRWLCQQ